MGERYSEKNIEKKKNILVIDDSALMRRVTSDIINKDPRFCVTDFATNGFEALDIIYKNYGKYDAVVCDINMPKMTGIEVLKALSRHRIDIRVVMSSTMTLPGAKETILALELGAFDFVTKPSSYIKAVNSEFGNNLMKALYGACNLVEEWDLMQQAIDEKQEESSDELNNEPSYESENDGDVLETETEIETIVQSASKVGKEEPGKVTIGESKIDVSIKEKGSKKEVKRELKVKPKVETKVEPKVKIEPKIVTKTESKDELRTEPKVTAKIETKTETKVAPKAEPKTETKVVAKAEPKTETKVVSKAEKRTEPKSVAKTDAKKEPKVPIKKEAKVAPKKESKKETKKEHKKDKIKPDYGMEKIVVIASSTGGPKALSKVIPKLQGDIDAPIVIVQHMPEGFTSSLAARLDEISQVKVVEAVDGEALSKGTVYIAKGGRHLKIEEKDGRAVLNVYDGPAIVGLKPCADITIESLNNVNYKEMLFVVLTGMGQDGTKGLTAIKNTIKKKIIVQDQKSSAVYGMPRAVANAGLADGIFALDKIAKEINQTTGVRKHGC